MNPVNHTFAHKSIVLKSSGGFFGGVRFPLHFTLLLLLSLFLSYNLPYRADYILREMTSLGSVRLVEFLGFNAFVEHGTFINIEGKRLSIISECTDRNYLLIFTAAVINTSASFNKKAFGLDK